MTIKRNIYGFLKDYPLYKPFETVSGYSRNCEGYTDLVPMDIFIIRKKFRASLTGRGKARHKEYRKENVCVGKWH